MTTTEAGTTTVYAIDQTHSSAEFSVKHLMVSSVKGRFRELEGQIYINDADPTQSWVEASINTASVETGVEMRDNDLRSDNFFDAERFPTMRFKSTSVQRLDDENWRLTGDLTIRDVTREVVLETEFEGRGLDPWGGERIGFNAETSISRGDFGLSYNAVLETGGVVVGDKVKITLNIEGVKRV